MKHGVKALACASLLVMGLGMGAAPASATTIGSTEGCTPGYWKVQQHWDSWQEAAPTDLFSTKFNMGKVPTVLQGKTMVDALQGGGGGGLDGARIILARAAAAAWLNAAYDDGAGHMAFPWRRYDPGLDGRQPLVPTVRAALNGTDRQAMIDLATALDNDNNLGCPLS